MDNAKKPPQAARAEYHTDPRAGLTAEQVMERTRRGLCNTVSDQASRTTKEISGPTSLPTLI